MLLFINNLHPHLTNSFYKSRIHPNRTAKEETHTAPDYKQVPHTFDNIICHTSVQCAIPAIKHNINIEFIFFHFDFIYWIATVALLPRNDKCV